MDREGVVRRQPARRQQTRTAFTMCGCEEDLPEDLIFTDLYAFFLFFFFPFFLVRLYLRILHPSLIIYCIPDPGRIIEATQFNFQLHIKYFQANKFLNFNQKKKKAHGHAQVKT